jgi:hypothetical protein
MSTMASLAQVEIMEERFEHRSQDSRRSLSDQILDQYHRQMAAERQVRRDEERRQGRLGDR